MKHTKLLMGVALLASASMLTACKDKDASPVAATVNGTVIKESLINKQLSGIPAQLLQGREAEIKTQILDKLINNELIQQEAKRLKIEKDEAYQAQLDNMKKQLNMNFVLKHKLDAELTDEALRKEYEAKKASMAYPAVKARHILVKTEAEAKGIEKIVNPKNFAQMAKEKSVGPSASKGGDLGWFRKEAMIPAFANAAFSAKAGTIVSKPVKTQFGWHIIFVEDKNDNFVPSFESVKDALKAELSQKIIQGYLKELRENAKIVIPESKKEETKENAETAK